VTSPADRFGYPDFNGYTILVIDDHEDGLEFVAQLLAFCGATVLKARSTAHARAHLKVRTPSLIVCDFQMPKETGVDFMRWMRRLHDERGSIPAIAVTAYPQDFLQQGDAAHAFDSYFVKPIDAPRFLRTVEAMLARGQSNRQVAM
jgi:two-component system, OmpR family, phosphate regulon response regulator PhoB